MSRKRAQHAYRPAPRKALAVDPQAFGFLFCEPSEEEAELIDGGIALVHVRGPLEHHAGWWGESYEAIEDRLAAALESGDVEAVVLCIDSPGGEVAGLAEMVRRMRALKATAGKPVLAYVDEQAASAGYALATIADAIYAPPSGTVGSCGVLAVVEDWSEANAKNGLAVAVLTSGAHKADGHPDVPLDEPARSAIQAQVDGLAVQYFALVAPARGLAPEDIEALEAATFIGADAVAVGLVDGVLSFDDLIGSLRSLLQDREEQPPSPSGETDMLIEQRALDAARKALAMAKTPATRKAAASKVKSAEAALNAAKQKAAARRAKAAAVTVEEETTTTTTTVEPDSEGPGDGEEDEEEDKDAEATSTDVLEAVTELTGFADASDQLGALYAMAESAKQAKTLATSQARTKADSRRQRVEAMVRDAMRAGKITPGQKAWALDLGNKDARALETFIATATPVVARAEAGGAQDSGARELPENASGGSAAGVTSADLEVAKRLGLDPKAMAETKVKAAAQQRERLSSVH